MTHAEGFAAIPNWMIRDLTEDELTIFGLAVYAALASHSGKGGIRPSVKTLAKESRCSETKVREALAELAELGVVKVVRRVKAKGVNDTNSYTLRPNGRVRGTSSREVGGTPPDEPGVPQDTEEGTSPHEGEEEPMKKNPLRTISTSGVQTMGLRFAQPLCDVLIAELIRNEVKVPEQVSKRWLDAARLMVDVDGRDPHQAKALIEWACRDAFWRSNILSMPKFREKFDALRLARDRGTGRRSTVENSREAAQILEDRRAQRDLQAVGS